MIKGVDRNMFLNGAPLKEICLCGGYICIKFRPLSAGGKHNSDVVFLVDLASGAKEMSTTEAPWFTPPPRNRFHGFGKFALIRVIRVKVFGRISGFGLRI